jgi:flagellar biosynthesis protein FliP
MSLLPKLSLFLFSAVLILSADNAWAQSNLADIEMNPSISARTLQILALITVLSLAPGIAVMITCFPFMAISRFVWVGCFPVMRARHQMLCSRVRLAGG